MHILQIIGIVLIGIALMSYAFLKIFTPEPPTPEQLDAEEKYRSEQGNILISNIGAALGIPKKELNEVLVVTPTPDDKSIITVVWNTEITNFTICWKKKKVYVVRQILNQQSGLCEIKTKSFKFKGKIINGGKIFNFLQTNPLDEQMDKEFEELKQHQAEKLVAGLICAAAYNCKQSTDEELDMKFSDAICYLLDKCQQDGSILNNKESIKMVGDIVSYAMKRCEPMKEVLDAALERIKVMEDDKEETE